RVPEVLVRVTRAGRAVPGALVFAEAEERQGMRPWGVRADGAGTSWFVLPEPGRYRFTCDGAAAQVEAREHPVGAPPGYGHVQRVKLELG
ncbi:MAG: hypothetical protein ABIL09_04650, partial [Gemmatimonadota bacterium]